MNKKYRNIANLLLIITLILYGCNVNEDEGLLSETLSGTVDLKDDMINDLILSKYNNYEKLDITAELTSIDTDNRKYTLTFNVTNNTDSDITYGLKWFLEIWKDNDWYTINFIEDGKKGGPAWPDVSYFISAGSSKDVEIEMFGYYDTPLSEGGYRLVRPFNRKLISLEFEI